MIKRAPKGDNHAGVHVAAIMDGNGRWALDRGRPRFEGHRAGAEAARRIVRAAPDMGVSVLSLFAFSSDNWNRPSAEVGFLFRLLGRFLDREVVTCEREGVRLRVIGRRGRLPSGLAGRIEEAETRTARGTTMELRLAVDYSSRDAILEAAGRLAAVPESSGREDFRAALGRVSAGEGAGASDGSAPDVDLLIRTGGEKRLSDFLLWECAYAELWFTDTHWPDFDPSELARALDEFRGRERRFGGLPAASP